MKRHTIQRELVAKPAKGETRCRAAAAPLGGPAATEDMLACFKLSSSTSVLADIAHPIMPNSLRGSSRPQEALSEFAAANDNRKMKDGSIPLVAFVVFTQIAAALLLILTNWYWSA